MYRTRQNSLRSIVLVVGLLWASIAGALDVNLTDELPYLDVVLDGEQVRIERIQDPEHRLTNSFAKTSRPCPPFCIHPMQAAIGVETVGEAELLDFLVRRVRTGEGLLIDSRTPDWFQKGTIPGAVNIPWTLFVEDADPEYRAKILAALGAVEQDGAWEFDDAPLLMMFCNGPWCDQSPRAIKYLVRLGYPPEKLYYYRGGMQLWQILGLTTVVPEA